MTRTEYNNLKALKEQREFCAEMSDWYAVTLREKAEIAEWWKTIEERVKTEGISED